MYDCELTHAFAHSSRAWFCVVQPACTCSSRYTCRFWLFLSKSEDVLENKRPRGVKNRGNLNFCAYEGKGGNVNNFSELAESWRWVLWAMEWPGWQRPDNSARTKLRGFTLARSVPFLIYFSARDAAWHGNKCFCCRDTFGHSSICKVGTGPVKASGNWGPAAHVGEAGEVAWGWPGTGAASRGPCTDGAEGACGFAARLVSSLQGHGASQQVGVSAQESTALRLGFC